MEKLKLEELPKLEESNDIIKTYNILFGISGSVAIIKLENIIK